MGLGTRLGVCVCMPAKYPRYTFASTAAAMDASASRPHKVLLFESIIKIARGGHYYTVAGELKQVVLFHLSE